jgi:hypothetical protein
MPICNTPYFNNILTKSLLSVGRTDWSPSYFINSPPLMEPEASVPYSEEANNCTACQEIS